MSAAEVADAVRALVATRGLKVAIKPRAENQVLIILHVAQDAEFATAEVATLLGIGRKRASVLLNRAVASRDAVRLRLGVYQSARSGKKVRSDGAMKVLAEPREANGSRSTQPAAANNLDVRSGGTA